MRGIFILKAEPKCFVLHCCPTFLPLLILNRNEPDLNWLAMVASEPVLTPVKNHFVSIFAACIPLYCGNKRSDQKKAAAVLQGSLLHITTISGDERVALIKKHMISIVSSLISLCSYISEPRFPHCSKETVILVIQTVVDGFLEIEQRPSDGGVVDNIHAFRPDRVLMFLLQIHYQIDSAVHARHQCHSLARLSIFIDIIKHRASVPSTCQYLLHLILLSLGFHELQDQCCHLMSSLLDIFKLLPSEENSHVIGSQLQSIVSKLVVCYFSSDHERTGERTAQPPSQVLSLLHRLTVDVDCSLYNYVKELDPFPDLDCFERIQKFHQDLCLGQTAVDEFVKFFKRTSILPQQLRLKSLQSLHRKLQLGEILCLRNSVDMQSSECRGCSCNPGIVSAVWRLVELCRNDNASDIRDLVGDFIARVGVGDPYGVAFRLPDDCNNEFCWSESRDGEGFLVSIPWKCGGVGDEDYVFVFQHVVLLVAEQFALDLTIIAAGKQPAFERAVDVGGCGYPAFITLNTL